MSESPHFHSFPTPREYYSSFTGNPRIQDGFDNIDDATNFRNYLRHLQNPGTRNFVLDFGNDDAWCSVNMENGDLAALLQKQVCGLTTIPLSIGPDHLLETWVLWNSMDVSRVDTLLLDLFDR